MYTERGSRIIGNCPLVNAHSSQLLRSQLGENYRRLLQNFKISLYSNKARPGNMR